MPFIVYLLVAAYQLLSYHEDTASLLTLRPLPLSLLVIYSFTFSF